MRRPHSNFWKQLFGTEVWKTSCGEWVNPFAKASAKAFCRDSLSVALRFKLCFFCTPQALELRDLWLHSRGRAVPRESLELPAQALELVALEECSCVALFHGQGAEQLLVQQLVELEERVPDEVTRGRCWYLHRGVGQTCRNPASRILQVHARRSRDLRAIDQRATLPCA